MSTSTPTVLQILPSLINGGVERGTVEMCQAIVRKGWRSIVVSRGGPMVQKVRHAGAEHIEMDAGSKSPLTIWRNAKTLQRIITKEKVSLIHARSRAPAWSAYIAAQKMRIPFVTTFHGFYGTQNALKRHYNSVMAKGDRVIVVSSAMKDHVESVYDIHSPQVVQINRGVDTAIFHPEKVRPPVMIELAEEWRLPDDGRPVILLPGRMTRLKGHHVFIDALAQLPHRNFMAVMLGDAGEHSAYRREIERSVYENGLDNAVRFAGSTREMTEAYMLANIVVSPSTQPESFGRVPVEAMAMGKLVIAANHGGVCESITDQKTGFLVEPGNASALSEAIDNALNLPEKTRDDMLSHAFWHAHDNLSIAHMQEQTVALYKELLGQ